jgi:hypothetical protein
MSYAAQHSYWLGHRRFICFILPKVTARRSYDRCGRHTDSELGQLVGLQNFDFQAFNLSISTMFTRASWV